MGGCHSKDEAPLAPGQLSLLVPFYCWPEALTFGEMAAAGALVTAVVTGGASGPPEAGGEWDSLYHDMFGRLAGAGVRLVGYVHADYGKRPLDQVLDDIALWYASYGHLLSGIFVDEVDSVNVTTSQRYLAAVKRAMKSHKATQILVLNPGVAVDAKISDLADIVLTFENSMAVWAAEKQFSRRGRLGGGGDVANRATLEGAAARAGEQGFLDASRAGAAPATTTAAAVHSTGPLTQKQIVKQMHRAAQLGYRHLHLTDGVPPDPWAALPSYWRQLVVAVNGEAPRNDAADGDRS
mmetsp:Transcript_13883/g.41923  ORF Transcript_13883/g.41923 Transcript_13883/m.41923 type:complete len:295 (+) Transcript_13883:570-1454(+)